ncbi:MAG TPA: glycosyltransferase [Acidimicrobiales bacterium]|nr:glycosyltransferase [Acidimicrobiales bacterium]
MSSPPGAEGTPTGTDDDQGSGSASPEESESLRRRLRNAEAATELLRAQLHGQEWLASRVSELESALARAETELDRLRAVSPSARAAIARALRTRAVRYLRSVSEPSRALPAVVAHPAALDPQDPRYPMWVECYDTVDDEARTAIGRRLDALSDPPLVSVILPVFDTPETYLREAIDSVRAQLYPHWELCIADDCSTSPWVPKVLAEYAAADPRIRVTTRAANGHISASSNSALELATGRWIALFDHDDLLAEHALALAVLAIAEVPGAGLLYSDEDHIDDDGRRSDPYMKPDFDPVLLLGQNYLSHLCMLRRDLVDEAGRYREGYEGSQDWDLVLRVCERLRPEQVVHVPHVLYHWRSHPGSTSVSLAAKPYAADAARRAVADVVSRRPVSGRVGNVAGGGFTRVHWDLPEDPPQVSVVVLPRRGGRFIRCIDSIKLRSTYPGVEVVVVDDGGTRAPLREFLRDWGPTLNVVREERDVSDSALRNRGAMAANGDVLCFVHDDVEVLTDSWLEEMVGLLAQPGIGAVGAKLLYDDGTVQHAGFVAGIGGTVGSPHRGFDRLEPGYFSRAALAQCFSAVSWAAMAVRREAFEAVGGFDEEHLSSIFGDVDFCFRLREAGWRTAFTPFAEMLHRGAKDEPRDTEGENGVRLARDIRYLQTRWADMLADDPAYSPNLSLAHETFPLAFPPRVSYRRAGPLAPPTGGLARSTG